MFELNGESLAGRQHDEVVELIRGNADLTLGLLIGGVRPDLMAALPRLKRTWHHRQHQGSYYCEHSIHSLAVCRRASSHYERLVAETEQHQHRQQQTVLCASR